MRAHLRQTDYLFLDLILCRDATIFIGNGKSKYSKQIIGLREAASLQSFSLKTEGASTITESDMAVGALTEGIDQDSDENRQETNSSSLYEIQVQQKIS